MRDESIGDADESVHSYANPESSSMRARLRIIVVGVGERGSEWVDSILGLGDDFELVGVVDNLPERREQQIVKKIRAYDTIDKLVEREGRVDGAVLALPPRLYAAVRRDCIRHGIAILQEKPVAASLGELVQLQTDLLNRPVPLLVAVQRRYHASYRHLKGILEKCRHEDIETLTVSIRLGRNPSDEPSGHRNDSQLVRGGAFIDLGYHAIDLVQFLINRPVELVSASMWSELHPTRVISWEDPSPMLGNGLDLAIRQEFESSADILARCDGVFVRVRIDRFGEKGEEVVVTTRTESYCATRSSCGQSGQRPSFECDGNWAEAVRNLLYEFHSVVVGERMPADLRDSLADMRVIESAYAAAMEIPVGGKWGVV